MARPCGRDRADIFVLRGNGDPFGEFDAGFRVPASRFAAAWNECIDSTPRRAFRSLEEALLHPDLARALLLGNSVLETLPTSARLENPIA